MVIVLWAGANLGLPTLTISHAADAKMDGDFGLVYQSLPRCRSGSNPAAGHLYQALPPHRRTEYYTGLELMMCGAVDEGDAVLTFIG